MYILLALIAACALGVALHFVLPHRELRGAAVTPAVAAATTAVVYTVMQWSGAGDGSVWLWLVSIGGGAAVALAATVLLSTQRRRRDAAARQALGI